MTTDDPVESRLTDIRNRLRELAVDQHSIRSSIERLSSRVEESLESQHETLRQVQALQAQLTRFIDEDRRARNLQFAQTALIDVRAERDRRYGHYDAVRRNVMGMLQAMDAGLVTQATLQQSAERLMLGTPDYWLAPVQVALAAWIRDNRPLAEGALLAAMSRDPDKTALFFSLTLARQGRFDASAKWIEQYVGQQDRYRLSTEFVVVLDAVAIGALGHRALSLVRDHCVDWHQRLRTEEDLVHQQTAQWRSRIDNQRGTSGHRFHVLPTICPDWDRTVSWLESATVYGRTEQSLRTRFTAVAEPPSDQRRRVDTILRELVYRHDREEAALRRRETRWKSIVEHKGDLEAAPAVPTETTDVEERADLLSLLTRVALAPRSVDAAAATQQFALALAGPWIENAVVDLSASYRNAHPQVVQVIVHGWRGELHPGSSAEEVAAEFHDHIDRRVDREMSQLTTHGQLAAALLSILGSAAVVVFVILGSLPFLWIILAIGLPAILGYRFLQARKTLPHRRMQLMLDGEDHKTQGEVVIRKALAEVTMMFDEWEAEMAKERSLVEYVRERAANLSTLLNPPVAAGTAPGGHPPHPPEREALASSAGDASAAETGTAFPLHLPDWDLLPLTTARSEDRMR